MRKYIFMKIGEQGGGFKDLKVLKDLKGFRGFVTGGLKPF
ncbi:hypothetical protein M2480_002641 [Parabacteroides sp. PFB2-12]|nr:hypothetical protein [Parabacteroides sp. PM6-13]MDH6391643.1 hypothetical protein [Parabacteroides sp. PFB2-12]